MVRSIDWIRQQLSPLFCRKNVASRPVLALDTQDESYVCMIGGGECLTSLVWRFTPTVAHFLSEDYNCVAIVPILSLGEKGMANGSECYRVLGHWDFPSGEENVFGILEAVGPSFNYVGWEYGRLNASRNYRDCAQPQSAGPPRSATRHEALMFFGYSMAERWSAKDLMYDKSHLFSLKIHT